MGAYDYKPLAPGRYGGLKPYDWPQDNIRIPNGFGLLPRVESLNANFTHREWFCCNAQFIGLAAGAQQSTVIPLDADGDFWLDNITFYGGIGAEGGLLNGAVLLQIRDISQGYNLFPAELPGDGIPLDTFNLGRITNVPGAGLRTSNLQPYCFLRATGIAVTLFMETWATNGPSDYYINFSGWKEYASAAN